MEYCTSFFGIALDNLKFKDIEDYFLESKDENDKIEYKSYSSNGNIEEKLKAICRTCCAFLNSGGGIIIWGSPQENKSKADKTKRFELPLSPLNIRYEKDTLVNKIVSNIVPLPNGIRVNILPDSTNSNYVCVFEIQKSEYAPHQYENTYYMRLDGHNRPAPHYYIEALFKQIRFPNLEGYVKFNAIQLLNNNSYSSKLRLSIEIIIFNFSPIQNEKNVSFRLFCDKGVFSGWESPIIGENEYSQFGHQLVRDRFSEVLFYGGPRRQLAEIDFNPSDLTQTNDQATLILHFGGESSPLKQSSYKILIRPTFNSNSVNEIIIEKKENEVVWEIQEGSGITKEQQLKFALDRE